MLRAGRAGARLAHLLALAQVVGLAVAATGAVLVYQHERTPAILLLHGPPVPRLSAGAADAAGMAQVDSLRTVHRYTPQADAAGFTPAPAPEPPPTPAPRTGVWLEIPALDIAMPLRKGDLNGKIPNWTVLQYPGTASPGAAGNSFLYAHGMWGMFGNLLYAKSGQEVVVRDYGSGATSRFHISKVVGKVRYDDSSWIRIRSGTPLLTLMTCTDLNDRGDRWIVQAA